MALVAIWGAGRAISEKAWAAALFFRPADCRLMFQGRNILERTEVAASVLSCAAHSADVD